MTGMERNSDIVQLASYAPLFVHVENRNWPTNMIVFDNHRYALPPMILRLFLEEPTQCPLRVVNFINLSTESWQFGYE